MLNKKEKMLKLSDLFSENEEVDFPIHAYIYIIKDFFSNGIFIEKEKVALLILILKKIFRI